jgi:hypothetical protein
MSIKKEYLILILIIAALSGYLFMRSFNRTLYELPAIPSLDPNQITKIEISQKNDSIVLEKKDNQWYLDPPGYLADENRVKDMLRVFETLRLTALVSEAKDYSRYDLDAEKRINVKAWAGDTLQRNFDIGKAAPSFRHTFVTLGGDSRVFHASDNFRNKFEVTKDSLRDKNVLSFSPADILEVQITGAGTSVKLTRSKTPVVKDASQEEKADTSPTPAVKFEWKSGDGEIGNEPNIIRLLTTLSSLRCEKYVYDRDKDSFSAPIYTINLKGLQDYRLDIFTKIKQDDKSHPAISSANDYPFFLSDTQTQQIMINPIEILKKPESDPKTSEPTKSK